MMKILRKLWESGTGTPYGQIKNRVPSHVDNRFWLPQYFIKQILIVTIIKFQGRKIMNPRLLMLLQDLDLDFLHTFHIF